jgi:hypothetical protein
LYWVIVNTLWQLPHHGVHENQEWQTIGEGDQVSIHITSKMFMPASLQERVFLCSYGNKVQGVIS